MCIGIHYLEKILLFENITLLKPLVDAPVCVWLCVRSCFCVLNSHQANLIAHKLVAASLKISINSWFTMTQFVIWAVFRMLVYHGCLTCTVLRTANSNVPDSIKLLIRF